MQHEIFYFSHSKKASTLLLSLLELTSQFSLGSSKALEVSFDFICLARWFALPLNISLILFCLHCDYPNLSHSNVSFVLV